MTLVSGKRLVLVGQHSPQETLSGKKVPAAPIPPVTAQTHHSNTMSPLRSTTASPRPNRVCSSSRTTQLC